MKKLKLLMFMIFFFDVGNSLGMEEQKDMMPVRIINKNIKQFCGDGENFLSFVVMHEGHVKDILPIPDEGQERTFCVDVKNFNREVKFQLGQSDNSFFGVHGDVYYPIKVIHSGMTDYTNARGIAEFLISASLYASPQGGHWKTTEFHFVTNRLEDNLYLLWLLYHRIGVMVGDGRLNEENLVLLSIVCNKYYFPISIEVDKYLNIDKQTHDALRAKHISQGESR